jgi:AAA domain
VAAAGARLVLTGDARQLGAVQAGGVLGLLDGHAETYTLADVRRFDATWEADASLALRDGNPTALAEYDRHGRLLGYQTTDEAPDAAAHAAVADRLDGRSVVVVTATNTEAASIAARIRASLVQLGHVDEGGVLLGRDGCTAGVGDLIACRRNDYDLGVTNRAHYRVTAVGDDGSPIVQPLIRPGGEPGTLILPASYVAEDVQLGYASTAHAAQGLTVDAAHVVTDGSLDGAGLYVGLTRGRQRNTAHVATTPDAPELPPGLVVCAERPSAHSVLEGCLEQDAESRAATVELEADLERRSPMATLAGQRETVVRQATRERMERHLDRLVEAGDLDQVIRARLCADQASEHLSRVLRAVEQAGGDPFGALCSAVTSRPLGDAHSSLKWSRTASPTPAACGHRMLRTSCRPTSPSWPPATWNTSTPASTIAAASWVSGSSPTLPAGPSTPSARLPPMTPPGARGRSGSAWSPPTARPPAGSTSTDPSAACRGYPRPSAARPTSPPGKPSAVLRPASSRPR